MFSDGYLRMTSVALQRVHLQHIRSSIDFTAVATSAGAAAGYTEWQGRDLPSLSIGWDWITQAACPRLLVGSVRSNLMLIDELGRDTGPAATSRYLERWLRGQPWQREVLNAIA